MDDIVIIAFLVMILFLLIKNKIGENFKTVLTRPTKKIAKKLSLKGKKMTPVIKKITPPDLKKLTPRTRRLYKQKQKQNKGYKPKFGAQPKIVSGSKLKNAQEVSLKQINTQEVAPYNIYSSSAPSINSEEPELYVRSLENQEKIDETTETTETTETE
jgi:hypothetical protein